jgi:dienelactone hydrolase
MRLICIVFALLTMAFAAAGTAAAAEQVDIPLADMVLRGRLFQPEGAGPFPSVVALHECESLISRSGKLAALYADWGERLAAAGSFGSRGLRAQCLVSERKVRSEHERVADANAARRWQQGQPWTIKDRVSLVGWASGGMASLWAVQPHALPRDGVADFRPAVAFYPSCRRLGELARSARIPTLPSS